MLEGDDYFIDAFIGRISCDSPNPGELQRALARYLRHERDMQNLGDLDMGAYHRATVFGGNYDDSGELTSSPVETCRWLAERLRERGYDVEEFYWERSGDNVDPGPIVESINRRINILAYRGWGDATGPHYPMFHKENLEELYNEPLLPILTFFVCNTGDFHNDDHMQCFGEYSILQGTRRTPRAGLVFFGSSDLLTKTRYNNPLFGGFYFSLLYRNIRNFAPLTLAAKMELWDGYPHMRERGRQVEFYTHIYNIIGDPEVTVYLDPPFTLEVEHTEQLYIGDSYTAFTVRNQAGNPVYGAMVTLRKTEETGISVLTDADGLALVPVRLDSEGELEVTVIAKQAFPYLATIPVSAAERNIGFAGVVVSNGDDDRLVTGAPVDLTVTLRNTGSNNSRGIIATLSSAFDAVEVIQASADFGDIAAGEFVAANGPFRVILSHEIPSADHVPFLLQITDDQQNSYYALFRLPISTGVVKYVNYEFEGGVINPGEAADLVVTVMSGGDMHLYGLTADVITYDNSITIVDNEAEFGDIGAGETVDCSGNPFRIEAEDGAADGRQVELIVRLTDSNDRRVNTMPFKIVIGDVGPEDPIGPDGYGYYAYENCDDRDRYPQVLEFDWIELDPDYGGEGAFLQRFVDDTTHLYELPFTFVFYGEAYDSIAVCSNGWISFEASNLYYNFRNWGMPSPLGPHSMIAPFWEDLVGDSIGNDMRDSLDIFTRYDEEEDRFIIEWSRVNARTSVEDHLETFELILFNPTAEGHQTETGDGEILMQYLDVVVVDRNETNYATVGIQDWLHRRGIEITYANIYHPAAAELEPERAILFTTIPADGYLDLTDDVDLQPVVFGLEHPSPNPFNSSVRIGYNLPGAGEMRLELLDVNGRLVRVLQSGEVGGGSHSLMLNAGLLPSGLYIVRLEAAGLTAQKKLVLLR